MRPLRPPVTRLAVSTICPRTRPERVLFSGCVLLKTSGVVLTAGAGEGTSTTSLVAAAAAAAGSSDEANAPLMMNAKEELTAISASYASSCTSSKHVQIVVWLCDVESWGAEYRARSTGKVEERIGGMVVVGSKRYGCKAPAIVHRK